MDMDRKATPENPASWRVFIPVWLMPVLLCVFVGIEESLARFPLIVWIGVIIGALYLWSRPARAYMRGSISFERIVVMGIIIPMIVWGLGLVIKEVVLAIFRTV
jgi:hypothetical protein